MDGHGVMTFPDGTVYDGEFSNNRAKGKGKITFSDGDVYEG
jgi:hypothetical protein